MALLTSQKERIRICITRMKKIGTSAASNAAAQMGTISLRRGYANSGYTMFPFANVTGNDRDGAGGA
jgi:hypothetical protein